MWICRNEPGNVERLLDSQSSASTPCGFLANEPVSCLFAVASESSRYPIGGHVLGCRRSGLRSPGTGRGGWEAVLLGSSDSRWEPWRAPTSASPHLFPASGPSAGVCPTSLLGCVRESRIGACSWNDKTRALTDTRSSLIFLFSRAVRLLGEVTCRQSRVL